MAACAVLGWAPAASAAFSVPQCDRFADSATGSDAGTGSASSPFRTVQKLADSLSSDPSGASDTGCLQGTFSENVNLTKPGAAGHPVLVTSAPGQRAHLAGKMTFSAPFVRVEGLSIDGGGPPGLSVLVFSDHDELANNDITHAGDGTCVQVGGEAASTRGTASLIDGNAIHNCGLSGHNDQVGISLDHATAALVTQNYVYSNPTRGIQLYPDSQGASIVGNVVDGNHTGIQFAGDATQASNNNQARFNAVSNNTDTNNGDYNIGRNYEGPAGTNNVVDQNCLDGPGGGIQPGQADIGPSNILADPGYVDRGHPPGGYALAAGTPCPGTGPQPQAQTGAATSATDARAADVVTARLGGAVLPHWQPGSYHFDYGTSAARHDHSTPARVIGGDLGQAAAVPAEAIGALEPSKTYFFRIVVTTSSGVADGGVQSFTTPAPPLLRPPFRILLHQSAPATKTSTRVKYFELDGVPAGAQVTASCLVFKQGCPIQKLTFRTGRAHQRFLAHSAMRPGAKLQIDVSSGSSATRTTFSFKRGHQPARSELCNASGGFVPCIAVLAPTLGPLVSYMRVDNPPPDARVGYICAGRGCPHKSRIVASGGGAPVVFGEFKNRRLKAGSTLKIFVVKANTIGVMTKFTLHKVASTRSDTCTVPTGLPTPTTCPAR